MAHRTTAGGFAELPPELDWRFRRMLVLWELLATIAPLPVQTEEEKPIGVRPGDHLGDCRQRFVGLPAIGKRVGQDGHLVGLAFVVPGYRRPRQRDAWVMVTAGHLGLGTHAR